MDGIKFRSAAEARRYRDLKLLEATGEIMDLKVHPRWKIAVNNVSICSVELDFSYLMRVGMQGDRLRFGHWKEIYEDVKQRKVSKRTGKETYTTNTRSSKIGQKLLKAVYGIDVTLFYM